MFSKTIALLALSMLLAPQAIVDADMPPAQSNALRFPATLRIVAKKEILREHLRIIERECPEDLQHLMLAIVYTESRFNAKATTKRGDVGLAQIHHPTWGDVFKVTKRDLLCPITNIQVAVKILMSLEQKYASKSPHWWTRYHSRHPQLRQKYRQRIEAVLTDIKEVNAQ